MKKIAEKNKWLYFQYKDHGSSRYDINSHNCQHFADALKVAYYCCIKGKMSEKYRVRDSEILEKGGMGEYTFFDEEFAVIRKKQAENSKDHVGELEKIDTSNYPKEVQELHKLYIAMYQFDCESYELAYKLDLRGSYHCYSHGETCAECERHRHLRNEYHRYANKIVDYDKQIFKKHHISRFWGWDKNDLY
jgi:hypothetical protein